MLTSASASSAIFQRNASLARYSRGFTVNSQSPVTIASVGLLIGGILPLDLRLAGLLRGVPLAVIGPFLSRSAAIGLALALVNVAVQHRNHHYRLALDGGAIHRSVRLVAGCSIVLWLAVLVAGRWIGFL